MIIDGHCHAGRGDGFTGPWDTAARLDRYLRRADAAGIARTVLLASFHSDYRAANREIAALVRSRPDRFIGFAFVHGERDRGRVHEMVRGFRGIKLHRHDARITREVCDVARASRLPVLYDVMGETAAAELLATEYPDVSFIIPHLGSFADDWAAQRALIDILVRRRNIYTDTSGVRRFDLLQEAVIRAGAHKVIFGTDGPYLHPGVELFKIRALGLAARDERNILGGNMARLLATRRRAPSIARARGVSAIRGR